MSVSASGRTRRLLLAVFLVALALRAVYFFQIRDSPFFESPVIDARTYHERAVEIAEGVWHEDEVFWQPPLYPYLLGAFYSLVGAKVALARLLQLLLGAVVCAGVAALATRLHGRLAGWVAGVAVAICGTSIFFEGELLNPVLSIALNTGALLALIPPGSQRSGNFSDLARLSRSRWAVAGVLLGLSAISRPDILVFAVALALAALAPAPPTPAIPAEGAGLPRAAVRRARRFPGLREWTRFAVFAGALSLPILPVTAHNVIFGGEWVPISSNAGLNLYLGNSTEYQRTVAIRPGLDWNQLVLEPLRAGVAEEDASGQSSWWARRTLAAVRAAPGRWLADLGRKGALGLAAEETGRNLGLDFFRRHAPILYWLPGWGLLFPLGVVGAFLAWRDRRDTILLALALSYAFTLLVFFVSARYRLPLYSVMAIFAGLAVDRAWLWWKSGRRGSVAAALGAVLALTVMTQAAGALTGRTPRERALAEADGHYLTAKALAHRGEHRAALAELERALTLAPENWDAAHDLAATWTNLDRPDLSVPIYRRILEHRPEDRESLLAMSDLLVRQGRKVDAIEALTEAAAGSWATPDLVVSVCRALFAMGEGEHALAVGRKALARGVADQTLEALVATMSRVETERHRLAGCLDGGPTATKGSAAVPLRVHRELTRASELLRAGEHLEAELAVSAALSECNDFAPAWSELGKLWFLQGAPGAAAAHRQAIRIDPKLAAAHLGLAYALAPDPAARAEAREALETYLALEPAGAGAELARRALVGLRAAPSEAATP